MSCPAPRLISTSITARLASRVPSPTTRPSVRFAPLRILAASGTWGTDLAVMFMRALRRWAHQRKLPQAEVFVDATNAFYSVVRALVLPELRTDLQLARILRDLNLEPEALGELAEAQGAYFAVRMFTAVGTVAQVLWLSPCAWPGAMRIRMSM